ncbi:hypothetical protein K435DRAFT_878040, partial [Dendrothele bispora CBS 962.96]
GKFVKTVRGDTPPGAGSRRFCAERQCCVYQRHLEELREALREKERETAQYRQAQVSSQFMNGAATYQPLPDHPGMFVPATHSEENLVNGVGAANEQGK